MERNVKYRDIENAMAVKLVNAFVELEPNCLYIMYSLSSRYLPVKSIVREFLSAEFKKDNRPNNLGVFDNLCAIMFRELAGGMIVEEQVSLRYRLQVTAVHKLYNAAFKGSIFQVKSTFFDLMSLCCLRPDDLNAEQLNFVKHLCSFYFGLFLLKFKGDSYKVLMTDGVVNSSEGLYSSLANCREVMCSKLFDDWVFIFSAWNRPSVNEFEWSDRISPIPISGFEGLVIDSNEEDSEN